MEKQKFNKILDVLLNSKSIKIIDIKCKDGNVSLNKDTGEIIESEK